MNRKLKIGILVGLVVAHIGLTINYVFVIYFMNHLQYGTFINGIDVGGWKVEEATYMLEELGQDYELVLEERGGEEEKIVGEDIEFKYIVEDEVEAIKEKQWAWRWLKGLWSTSEYEVEIEVVYNEDLLEEKISALECLKEEKSIAPENAGLKLVAGSYEIIEGNPGSLVKENILMEAVKDAVQEGEKSLSLEEEECYELPKITVDDAKLKAKRDTLNRYVDSTITYDFGDRQEVIDGEVINEWVNLEGEGDATLNEEAVRRYVDQLADTYDTLYGTRSFQTSVGTTVTIVGGDYGWKIDRQGETQALITLLETGQQDVVRTPIYAQEGYCRDKNDVGNTYVEINLTRQYLWFYKNGQLVTEGSIVSGMGTNSHATPEGTYKLDYKQAHATLKGPGYSCPVSYWMPFNLDIGIHDATWRGAFGDNIYMYDGSHGCINAPLDMARIIFNEIEQGVPVICYKD